MTWNPAKLVTMTRMWAEGASAAEIGREIGMTRNAVLGKAHRLRMPSHQSKVKTAGGRPKGRKPVRPAVLAKPKPVESPPRPCKLFDLQWNSCRWPHGDPCDPAFYFCGAVTVEPPYCLAHGRLAYAPRY